MNKQIDKIKNFDAIIYHGPCFDGTSGLWCACYYKSIKNRFACKAGINPIGDYTGMNVLFVDICPKLDYLLDLVKKAKFVVILDHHKSSQQMIIDNELLLLSVQNLYIEFDMKRSGCQITWDYFFDSKPRPFFIDYIADRDLWTWLLPSSKQINTALYELNYIDSYNLDKLTDLLVNSDEKIEYLINVGNIIEIGIKKQIDICSNNAIEAKMIYKNKTFKIWLAGNINPGLKSEIGNVLCSKSFKDGTLPDFSAIWQFEPKTNEWWISLRGIKPNSPDLSLISTSFGGGGHPLASGLSIKSIKGLKEIFIY